jgi:thioredoxin-like negative regulator of GroEL
VLKPDHAEAHFQMATILIGQNKTAEAVASLERFLALAPDHEKAGIARQLLEFLKK